MKLTLNEIKNFLNIDENAETAKVKVTPEQAKVLLSKTNKINRRINKKYVETYKRDMEKGNWYSDIDYIGFNLDGILINGQHRLKALSIANVDSILLKFDFNVDQHISMDTGNARKYTDQVTISKKAGKEILPNKFRPIINTSLKLCGQQQANLSNSELCKLWDIFGDDLLKCENSGIFSLGSKISSASVKSALFLSHLSGVDINILSHISEVLNSGISKSETDIPIIRLRDELMVLKGSSKDIELRRAGYTQQCVYNVLNGYTTNRLPSNPSLRYSYDIWSEIVDDSDND